MAEEKDSQSVDIFTKTVADVRRFWERLPKQVRVLMVAVVIFAVAAGAALTVVERTDQQVLFSGLTNEDAAAIVEHLKGQHIQYRLEAGGGTILVPREHVHELRLSLAAEGIPVGSGVGFELFDEQRFGMTEFEERIALRRALEGELSRTITRLDAVRTARTHLVLPKQSLLGSRSSAAQGSIIIELQKGRELSGGTIRSIVHLVSSSVAGLSPDHVTVVDTRGRLLSSEAGLGFNNREFEYQKKFEQDMELRLREMLHQILGPTASVVRVAANFDFSKRESTEEHYDPDRSVLRSEQRETETMGSKTTGAGGTPGTRSNLPGGTPPTSSIGGQSKRREAETRNYEVDKVINRVVSPTANLSRISVAVLVNGTNAEGEPFVSRPAEELHKIEMAVRGATGFDATRGDSIEVQSIPFHVPEKIEEPVSVGPSLWKEWLPIGVGVAVALALIIAALSLRRGRPMAQGMPIESLPLPKPVRELEAIIERPEGLPAIPSPSAESNATAALMGNVRQVFMDESEGASRVLKSWLSEARKPEEAPPKEVV
ncbi:MAG: flagellar M-ring protein FliF [Proteobacteria bacterium]|nr:flagellar M-ring protein FliF [Pseudomonadota bacterium]